MLVPMPFSRFFLRQKKSAVGIIMGTYFAAEKNLNRNLHFRETFKKIRFSKILERIFKVNLQFSKLTQFHLRLSLTFF